MSADTCFSSFYNLVCCILIVTLVHDTICDQVPPQLAIKAWSVDGQWTLQEVRCMNQSNELCQCFDTSLLSLRHHKLTMEHGHLEYVQGFGHESCIVDGTWFAHTKTLNGSSASCPWTNHLKGIHVLHLV